MISYLDLDDVLALAAELFGSPPVRDMGLLGAAVERPMVSAFGEDAYPDIWAKAAALLHSIVNNHPLVDGNKRLGWLATRTFLLINGEAGAPASQDDIYDFVIGVVNEPWEINEIADRLQRLLS